MLYGRNFLPCSSQMGGRLNFETYSARTSCSPHCFCLPPVYLSHVVADELGHEMRAPAGTVSVRPLGAATPRLSALGLLFEVGAGLLLLLIAPAPSDRMRSVIDGADGGVEDVSTVEVDEASTPPDNVTPAIDGLAAAANPLISAKAAPVATAPARTRANVVEPTSPAMTRLAISGISAIAKA